MCVCVCVCIFKFKSKRIVNMLPASVFYKGVSITGNDSNISVGLLEGKEWRVWCVSRCACNEPLVHVCLLTITL